MPFDALGLFKEEVNIYQRWSLHRDTQLPHIWSPFKSPEGEVNFIEPKGNGSHEKVRINQS